MTDIEEFKKLFNLVNLRQRYLKSMQIAEMVHHDHLDCIKDFEIDFELEDGLKTCEQMLKDIEAWQTKMERIRKGANKISENTPELPENLGE